MQDLISYCRNCGTQVRADAQFCPECGSKVREAAHSVEIPVARKTSRRSKVVATVFIVAVLAFGLTVFVRELVRDEHPIIASQPTVAEPIDYRGASIEMTDISSRVENGRVIFSLDDVKKHGLVRLQYKGRLTDVPIMAYISGEGKLVTAISRSEPDNATTFSIEGTSIKCGNCPANWQLNNMKANACCPRFHPDPIPSSVVGNDVHIEEMVVANWTSRL